VIQWKLIDILEIVDQNEGLGGNGKEEMTRGERWGKKGGMRERCCESIGQRETPKNKARWGEGVGGDG